MLEGGAGQGENTELMSDCIHFAFWIKSCQWSIHRQICKMMCENTWSRIHVKSSTNKDSLHQLPQMFSRWLTEADALRLRELVHIQFNSLKQHVVNIKSGEKQAATGSENWRLESLYISHVWAETYQVNIQKLVVTKTNLLCRLYLGKTWHLNTPQRLKSMVTFTDNCKMGNNFPHHWCQTHPNSVDTPQKLGTVTKFPHWNRISYDLVGWLVLQSHRYKVVILNLPTWLDEWLSVWSVINWWSVQGTPHLLPSKMMRLAPAPPQPLAG